jgi:hypothetical protein
MLHVMLLYGDLYENSAAGIICFKLGGRGCKVLISQNKCVLAMRGDRSFCKTLRRTNVFSIGNKCVFYRYNVFSMRGDRPFCDKLRSGGLLQGPPKCTSSFHIFYKCVHT